MLCAYIRGFNPRMRRDDLLPSGPKKYHGLLATVKIGTLLGRTNTSEGWSGIHRKEGEGEEGGC